MNVDGGNLLVTWTCVVNVMWRNISATSARAGRSHKLTRQIVSPLMTAKKTALCFGILYIVCLQQSRARENPCKIVICYQIICYIDVPVHSVILTRFLLLLCRFVFICKVKLNIKAVSNSPHPPRHVNSLVVIHKLEFLTSSVCYNFIKAVFLR